MGRRHLEANQNLDEVMECYRRIHGHLKRLTVSITGFAFELTQIDRHEVKRGPEYMEDRR